MPYAVARSENINRAGNPFRDNHEMNGDVGLDLKYRVTSNMTLDATVNPDFGQVEVDPAVINLTAFETFFPEKRPFFVEGAQVFAFSNMSASRLRRDTVVHACAESTASSMGRTTSSNGARATASGRTRNDRPCTTARCPACTRPNDCFPSALRSAR